MKEYQVTTTQVTLTAGLVKLTAEQSRPRAHALKATADAGVFEILQPVSFKSGELFSWDGQMGKGQADDLTPPAEVAEMPAQVEAEKPRGRGRPRKAAGSETGAGEDSADDEGATE